jgi:hypothetical protein
MLHVTQNAFDVMGALKSKCGLCGEIEQMLSEISSKFLPDPEEDVLALVNALLMLCYQQAFPKAADVPRSIQSRIDGICKSYFSENAARRSLKHKEFVDAYREQFEADFLAPRDPASGGPVQMFLWDLILNLKKWRVKLQLRVDAMHSHFRIEQLSRVLAEFQPAALEMPGQYLRSNMDSKPHDREHVRLVRFHSEVIVLKRNGFLHRRLAVRGTNGRLYHFVVQFLRSYHAHSDERMLHLSRFLNR